MAVVVFGGGVHSTSPTNFGGAVSSTLLLKIMDGVGLANDGKTPIC
ncbi:MAG: hypothetical protein ACJZZ7_05115 [Cytophagales bacterium]